MKFSVGYSPINSKFCDYVISVKERIDEVYFSWGDFQSGRNKMTESARLSKEEALEIQKADLKKMSDSDIKFNLLFNANCYGDESLSVEFFNKVGDTVDFILNNYGLSSITTTSPVIAGFIKSNFPTLEVKASINMEIGTKEGAEYLFDSFDGFYLKREFNRNFKAIKEMKEFLDNNGKKLYMLANSGCLNYCSLRTFHDNLVAHESEIMKKDNALKFVSGCSRFLSNPNNFDKFFKITNFIRPEDIHLYEEYFPSVKLATRVSRSPERTLRSYINGKYIGPVTDLLEPDNGHALFPYVLENSDIFEDFGIKTATCDKNCNECGYCKEVFNKCAINVNDKF